MLLLLLIVLYLYFFFGVFEGILLIKEEFLGFFLFYLGILVFVFLIYFLLNLIL